MVLIFLLVSGIVIGVYIDKYGDGVKVIVLWVDDVIYVFEEIVKRGVKLVFELMIERDEFGEVVKLVIYIYGEVLYVFVEWKNYDGVFLLGFK